MALINRVSRLFKADVHAVLDRIEEPEQMLRQAVRDMENEISVLERHIAQLRREQSLLESRRRELQERVEKTDQELDLCFEKDKPDLARGLVRQKLETERLTGHLDSRLGALSEELERGEASLDKQRTTLESTRQKAEVFAAYRDNGGDDGVEDDLRLAEPCREFAITDAEVDIAMLREAQRRGES